MGSRCPALATGSGEAAASLAATCKEVAVMAPPIIDISPLLAGEDHTCAQELHRACLDTGFFVAVGHGLDDPMESVFAAARSFFGQTQEFKERTPRISRYGYVPNTGMAIDVGRQTGQTEFIDLGLGDEVVLPDVPGLERAVRCYQAAALGVGSSLMRVIAEQLGAPGDFFAERMTQPQCRLRFLHYLPMGPEPDGTQPVPTAPHTDYGAITLLATDGVPGLEVKPIGGDWTAVVAPPGSLVVNIGDMLARWTNDVYRSTPHRVIASPENHRLSIPFFVNPNPETVVECIPACATAERPCHYEPILAGEYLTSRIDSPAEPYI